jgi:MoxR-like ATPase
MKFSHLMNSPSIVEEPVIDMSILEMAGTRKTKVGAAAGAPDDAANGPQAKSEKIPEFKPSNAALTQTTELFHAIFDNMKNKRTYKQYVGMLLSGDPGTGKTQRITLLSKVLGIDLITVEAPHIVEEHIINIPFIVFDSETNKKTGGTTALEGDLYKVVLSDSNLYSALKKITVVPDDQHLKNIYKSTKDVIATYEAIGGTPTQLPDEIVKLRKRFKVILFLDEYFRQTSPRIKNMLRGILNGQIGNHDIPENTYIIYATNLKDEGLAEIQQNFQFEHFEVEKPNKDEWFTWLVHKFSEDSRVTLKPNLINRFHHILNDEDISADDADKDVRTSPRRWEQLLLYINAALPAKDEHDAIGLMTNVKTNFRNYLSGEHADLAKKVLEATAELIKETSGIEVSANASHSATNWRSTLQHQIETKMKLGDLRKYIPIVSGLPGIGKTAQASKLAKDLDLRYIPIDCSTISPEDVAGLPLPGKGGPEVLNDFIEKYGEKEGKRKYEEDHIETTFSMPGLYQLIMEKIADKDKKYIKKLEKKYSGKELEAAKKEYENRPYKYMIFFDELNRNSTKVFNGIRRVLLEKNFGPSSKGKGKLLELPKEAIMIGAINPTDAGGSTVHMTKHVQDVLDVIDAKSSWKDTLHYLEQNIAVEGDEEPEETQVHDISLSIIKSLVDVYETKDPAVSTDTRPFFWDIGQEIYIAPREYFQIFAGLVKNLGRELKKVQKLDLSSMTANELRKIEKNVKAVIFSSLKRNTSFILFKQSAMKEMFYHGLEAWIMNPKNIDLGENFFYTKAFDTKKMSLHDIIGEHLEGTKSGMHENDSFVAYIKNTSDIQKLREDISDIMINKFAENNGKNLEHFTEKKWPAIRFARRGKLYTKKDLAEDKNPDGILLDESKKVSSLENFFRELFISAKIHNISGDRVTAIWKSFYAAMAHSDALEKKLEGKVSPEDIEEFKSNTLVGLSPALRGIEHLSNPKNDELPDE